MRDSASVAARAGRMVDADHPWPGLESYTEDDVDFFHGRDDAVEELCRLVERERLAVLFGLSGLGKTSLVRAGLFPRVRDKDILPVYIRLDFAERSPSLRSQVFVAAASAAADAGAEAPLARDGDSLWEFFHRTGATFWSRRNRVLVPLLTFDQFEEVFTLGGASAQRATETAAFLDELADLIEGRPPASVRERLDVGPDEAKAFNFSQHSYKVLLSLREDFLPELESLRAQVRGIALNRLRLRQMDGLQALSVVTESGEELLAPGVAESIVRAVAQGSAAGRPLDSLSIEPAILSLVCHELNEKRIALGESTISVNLLDVSRTEILTQYYERSVEGLPELRSFIEDRLLTASGYRESVAVESALQVPGIADGDIGRLVNARLLRVEERGGVERLELTHDVLTSVVRASRDARRRRESEAASRVAAEEASRRNALVEEARAAKRFRRLAIGLAAVCFVAVDLAYFAITRSREAGVQLRIADSLRTTASNRFRLLKSNRDLRSAFLDGTIPRTNAEPLQFHATATFSYRERDTTFYHYTIWPDSNVVPGGLAMVNSVMYRRADKTMLNTNFIAGADRQFTIRYDGFGCNGEVLALIELRDVDAPVRLARLDLCDLIDQAAGKK